MATFEEIDAFFFVSSEAYGMHRALLYNESEIASREPFIKSKFSYVTRSELGKRAWEMLSRSRIPAENLL